MSETRWHEIRRQFAELSQLDLRHGVFGASTHRYRFGPVVTPGQIDAWERRHGVTLPADLRTAYLVLGDGTAGPAHGLRPLNEVRLFRPTEPFLGEDHLSQAAKDQAGTLGYRYETELDWSVPVDLLTGLLGVIDYGEDIEICLVVAGQGLGQISWVHPNDASVLLTQGTLAGLFNNHLQRELDAFEMIRSALMSDEPIGVSIGRLFYNLDTIWGDYLSSFLDLDRPDALFGADVAERRDLESKRDDWLGAAFHDGRDRLRSAG
ncbi:MAG: hypothetical protein AAF439_00355 [Pseudomonadota bacterium]